MLSMQRTAAAGTVVETSLPASCSVEMLEHECKVENLATSGCRL